MSSVITPTTYDLLQARKYNLWGGLGTTFPRQPGPQFEGVAPTAKTNPTFNDIKAIEFDPIDNGKVITADLEIHAKQVTPDPVLGFFRHDGLSNTQVKMLDPFALSSRFVTYTINARNLYTVGSGSIGLSRSALELESDEYPISAILGVFTESQFDGAWITFSTSLNLSYKVIANIDASDAYAETTQGGTGYSKPNSSIYDWIGSGPVEGQTVCIPIERRIVKSSVVWDDTMTIRYRCMAKIAIALCGVIYYKEISP